VSDRPVALVTGSSRGIGRNIALAFAERSWNVAVHYGRSRGEAEETARRARDLGAEAAVFGADVGDPAEAADLASRVEKTWGRLDALVNNAGVTRDRSILKMMDEEWNEVLRVNLTGAFWCLRECARVMSRRRSGAVINVASILGLRGSAGASNYAASKAGLIGLTKSAAKELGRFNIRVNAVLPGYHQTDMGMEVWEKHGERILSEHVLGRLTDVKELGRFVVFLAEQGSASGQVYNFDSRVL